MEPIFDLQWALERFEGDRDVLLEVAQIFLEDCPASMSEIRSAIARKDAATLTSTAHSLKGSMSNFSPKGAEAAFALEQMGHDGRLAGAEQAYKSLEAIVGRLIPALATLQREHASA